MKFYNSLRPASEFAKPMQNTPVNKDMDAKQALAQLFQAVQGGVPINKAAVGLNSNPLASTDYDDYVHPNIYGRSSIFDCCQPSDIFGLQVSTSGLMPWLGWRSNRFYQRRVGFIPWYGPEGMVAGTITTGAASPCDYPDGWEFGVCGYHLNHTSWYARMGEGLDPHTIVQDRCETTPRFRLNGQPIADDLEWQLNGIMNVLQSDIRRGLIHGSHSNARQMDGLESLIKTGYTNDDGTTCPQIDSILVNWASDGLDGEVNGYGNFFDYLDEIVTEIEYRSKDLGGIAATDMILLTSRFMATCLLDAFSCYTTCGVTELGDVSDQALRAQQRQNRRDLNGGPLYDGTTAVGFIALKSGRRIPIIVDDYLDISHTPASGKSCTDIYLLTRRIGSIDVLYGEYLDLSVWETRVKAQYPGTVSRADAAGRFLARGVDISFCIALELGTSPEIYIAAPWAQARIENVCCTHHRVPFTGDPNQPAYLPGGRPLHTVNTRFPTTDLDD